MTFTILNRKKQFTGHAFDVSQIEVRLPDGRERQYDLVEHVHSVTILPVDVKGQVHFVSQYRIAAEARLLELPAGVLEPGESPLEGAKREIREEIGMAAGKMQLLGSFFLAPGYSNEYMTVFLATDLFDSPLDPDADEFLKVSILTIPDAYRLAEQGEFKDAKTLATLLLAKPFLNNLQEPN